MQFLIKKPVDTRQWNMWFAWYPVILEDDGDLRKIVWLENICRKTRNMPPTKRDWVDKLFYKNKFRYKRSILDILQDS